MSHLVTNWRYKNILHYSGSDSFFLPIVLTTDLLSYQVTKVPSYKVTKLQRSVNILFD